MALWQGRTSRREWQGLRTRVDLQHVFSAVCCGSGTQKTGSITRGVDPFGRHQGDGVVEGTKSIPKSWCGIGGSPAICVQFGADALARGA